jgi:hypothetical protein
MALSLGNQVNSQESITLPYSQKAVSHFTKAVNQRRLSLCVVCATASSYVSQITSCFFSSSATTLAGLSLTNCKTIG